MKVYVVIMDSGTIYSISKSKEIAKNDKAYLEKHYECHPTIKAFNVQ